MLEDLITSKTRIKLLKIFLSYPSEMYHVRDLSRKTNEEINAVRRELEILEKKGILIREPRANRVYYYLNKNYTFYFDLLKIGAKSIGLGYEILKNKIKLGKINYAMLSGKFIRRMNKNPEEVDFLIVGKVVLPEIALLVKNEEARLDTEINYTVMTEEEFHFRKTRNDPFINQVLSGSRVMLIGDEEDMLS